MRVFVPATMPLLAHWHSAGVVEVATGYAVTAVLRESYATGDTEELEYAVMCEAARHALRLLAADADAPPRRVVVAADTDVVADASLGRAGVRLTEPVSWASIASVHVDDVDAEDVIRGAVDALDAADAGDPDAAFTVAEPEGFELAWYATQEIPLILGFDRP